MIELHDSEIAIITYDHGTAKIIFARAYIHRSEGEPGRAPGTGWGQRAELVIGNASEIGRDRGQVLNLDSR